MRRNRHRFPLLPLIAACLLCACDEPAKPEQVLRPVRTETAYASGAETRRIFSGVARAGLETQLSFRVPGSVQRVRVQVGDRVSAGALIASLERSDFEIAVRQAEAALDQARASKTNAEADLERVRGLWESQNASQGELDAASAKARSVRAQVAGAEQSLEAARRQLSYTELRAPVQGSIAAVAVEANENVGAGQAIVLLTSGSRPEVEIAIPGVLIAQIEDGDAVQVTFDALAGTSFEGVVTEVGIAATGAATTYPVTVRLAQAPRDVRSGMAADVTFTFRSAAGGNRIYLPSHAVGSDRDGRFVFLLEAAETPGVGVVRRTPVEIGGFHEDRLEITAGVAEGQEVVTAGVRLLTDGQRVKRMGDEEAVR